SMKPLLRRHVGEGIVVPPGAAGNSKLRIMHIGSGQSFEMPVVFDSDGIATNPWKIPNEAKHGDYEVALERASRVQWTGRFKVEEFRLPTMRASVTGPARPLVRPRDMTLDLHVAYISGGGASGLPVKLRTVIEPWPLPHAG